MMSYLKTSELRGSFLLALGCGSSSRAAAAPSRALRLIVDEVGRCAFDMCLAYLATVLQLTRSPLAIPALGTPSAPVFSQAMFAE